MITCRVIIKIMTTPIQTGVSVVNENALQSSKWGFRDPAIPLSRNTHLLKWVEKMAKLTQPAAIHWVDGSQEEYDTLCDQMIDFAGRYHLRH